VILGIAIRGGNLSEAAPNVELHAEQLGATDPTRVEKPGCLLCGSSVQLLMDNVTDTRFGILESYAIDECRACGFEQISCIPSRPKLKALYEEHYNFGGEAGTLYTRLRERFFLSSLYRLWAKLDGDISFHLRQGRGRLLDVGCNEGRGLTIYARNGFQVEGLELNENAAAVARQRGFLVHTCLLSELSPTEPYRFAVLSNVLEHSLDPREMIEDVSRVLDPGGEIWVSCPNSKSWLRKVFGKSWINWHVPFHISHFSPGTLRKLLLNAGYEKIEIRHITPGLWVASSIVAYVFAKPGKKNRQLRNPLLIPLLILLIRFVLFPGLWLGNLLGCGDCLLAVASKGAECES
jgi:SAM-dependent methyltransferase